MCSTAGSSNCAPTTRRDQRGEQVLALDADVEQVHLEPDRDGDRAKISGVARLQRLEQLVAVGAVSSILLVDGARVSCR